jgi:hypothetical protein
VCKITANVSKDDVKAFNSFCVSARAMWAHYHILFEGMDLQRELLQSIAGDFFYDLHAMLTQNMILRICQITDPEETMGRKNLTVKFLIKNSDFPTPSIEARELQRLSDSMHAFRAKIAPARNKFISHLDRESVRRDSLLGAASRAEWGQLWTDLEDFLRIMQKRYIDPNGHFELNSISLLSDADDLVKALKESAYFHILLADKETTKRSAEVAFNSKFSNA